MITEGVNASVPGLLELSEILFEFVFLVILQVYLQRVFIYPYLWVLILSVLYGIGLEFTNHWRLLLRC